ncbi:MAG: hypothetical protein AB7L91_18430 [Dehalococcoidia bacterium]
MTHLLTGLQGLGVLAVAVGLAGLLPLWWAVFTIGLLALVAGTAAEHVVRKAHRAPQDRRRGPIAPGVG